MASSDDDDGDARIGFGESIAGYIDANSLLPHGTAFEFLVTNGVEIMRAIPWLTPKTASQQAKTVRGVAGECDDRRKDDEIRHV